MTALLLAAALSGPSAQQNTTPVLPPVEELAAADVETYRAQFERLTGLAYPDRMGAAEAPVVIFERRPGETPRVVVLAGERRMEGPVSEDAWLRVRRQGRTMADVVGPHHLSPEGNPDPVCTGPMLFTTVEMTPERVRAPDGTPWRGWEELAGCGYGVGLIGGFGDEMARLALTLLPPCDSLSSPTDTNPSRSLAQCLWLDGDRLAGVQFLNERRFRPGRTHANGPGWRDWHAWFGQGEPDLDWPGYAEWVEARDLDQEGADRDASDPAAFLAQQSGRLENLSIWYTSIRGDGARQITTEGVITAVRPGATRDDDVDVIAKDRQVWTSGDRGGWELRSWRVEPFRPQGENDSY